MKKFLLLIVLLFGMFANSYSLVQVNGYYRSNGTYVQPHYRTSPDGIKYNNLSYRP